MSQQRQFDKMGNDFKAEARKQYFKYFRIWFGAVAVLLAITLFVGGAKLLERNDSGERKNDKAPVERVYDYADVLTDEEEQNLRILIAKKETEIRADIVLVTISEYMGESDAAWENAMMNYADDFYDHNNYGYDKVHGSGVLLLDNYYEGQAGSWLSTCGDVYEEFGDYEINRVLDAVYYGLDNGAYNAYSDYVYTVCNYMQEEATTATGIPFIGILVISTITALIYAFANLRQVKAKDTTQATTYVAGGRPVMNVQRDDFIRKSVVKRRIESSSSGGSSSGGRGGSHRSSSGVRHGGGGRRR